MEYPDVLAVLEEGVVVIMNAAARPREPHPDLAWHTPAFISEFQTKPRARTSHARPRTQLGSSGLAPSERGLRGHAGRGHQRGSNPSPGLQA